MAPTCYKYKLHLYWGLRLSIEFTLVEKSHCRIKCFAPKIRVDIYIDRIALELSLNVPINTIKVDDRMIVCRIRLTM